MPIPFNQNNTNDLQEHFIQHEWPCRLFDCFICHADDVALFCLSLCRCHIDRVGCDGDWSVLIGCLLSGDLACR